MAAFWTIFGLAVGSAFYSYLCFWFRISHFFGADVMFAEKIWEMTIGPALFLRLCFGLFIPFPKTTWALLFLAALRFLFMPVP